MPVLPGTPSGRHTNRLLAADFHKWEENVACWTYFESSLRTYQRWATDELQSSCSSPHVLQGCIGLETDPSVWMKYPVPYMKFQPRQPYRYNTNYQLLLVKTTVPVPSLYNRQQTTFSILACFFLSAVGHGAFAGVEFWTSNISAAC